MKFTAAVFALLFATAPIATSAAEEKVHGKMYVDRYAGPAKCDDEDKIKKGDHVQMHYVGTIAPSSATGTPGKKFDSSYDRGITFDFQIGVGMVIKGWDAGLLGLCKGAKANLTIPPEMGYGEQGAGSDIPGGATLHFDVEVVSISDKAPPGPNFFKEIDTDEDGKLTKGEVEAFFREKKKSGIPDGLWESEDKDGDGFITWEEFGGAKGDNPPGEEL